MKQVCTLFLLFTLVSSLSFAQSDEDALWQQTINHFSKSQDWIPGKIVSNFELLNGNGDPEEVTQTTMKIFQDDNGNITSKVVEVVQNGNDRTESAQEKQGEPQNRDFSMKESLFHPENQDRLERTRLSDTRIIDGQRCVGYEYTLELEEETRNGTVWIDAETGLPVENVYSPDPLPKRVKKLENRVTFSYTPDGSFYVDRLSVEGRGGVLFIQKEFRMEMTFYDYWKHESN